VTDRHLERSSTSEDFLRQSDNNAGHAVSRQVQESPTDEVFVSVSNARVTFHVIPGLNGPENSGIRCSSSRTKAGENMIVSRRILTINILDT
jgi:hypothetical protein